MSNQKLKKRVTQAVKELKKANMLTEGTSVLLSTVIPESVSVVVVENEQVLKLAESIADNEPNDCDPLAVGYNQLVDDGIIEDGELVVLKRCNDGRVRVVISNQEDDCES